MNLIVVALKYFEDMAQKEQQMLAAYNLFSAGGLSYDARHTQFSLEMPLTNMLVTPRGSLHSHYQHPHDG